MCMSKICWKLLIGYSGEQSASSTVSKPSSHLSLCFCSLIEMSLLSSLSWRVSWRTLPSGRTFFLTLHETALKVIVLGLKCLHATIRHLITDKLSNYIQSFFYKPSIENNVSSLHFIWVTFCSLACLFCTSGQPVDEIRQLWLIFLSYLHSSST